MTTFSFTSSLAVLGAASALLLPAVNAGGQTTATTSPVGYLQTACLSGSDTLVAPPFTRPAAFVGAVASVSGNVITLGSSSLTADQFDAPTASPPTSDSYYLSIGPATATLTGTLTVTSGSTAVTGSGTTFGTDVKVGDRITINDSYNLLTYTVMAIASPTSLMIDRVFADSAATGSASTTSTTSKMTAVRTATTTALKGTAATTSASLSGLSATYDHSPYEGRFYQVTSNGASTVTVNLNGDTLAAVAAGTQISVIPYWTLNAIFPAANVGVSFTATTSSRQTNTQILIPNYSGVGINLSSAASYIYYSDGASNIGWRKIGDLTTDRGYEPLLPDGYFTVRTPSGVAALPVTFSGTVPTNKAVTLLATSASTLQDNAVALSRPADATLGSIGLNPVDGSFLATTSSRTTKDQLLVYDNSTAAINKSSAATYIYYNDGVSNVGWRKIGDLTTDRGSDVIPAASALTIRKAVTTAGQTAIWTNIPNY